MTQDDIEKILQQYGADRRQQRQAADTLHGLARRQKWRGLMVCTALLLATTVWSAHRLATPRQAESTIVAQQNSPSVRQTPTEEPTPQKTCPSSHHNTRQPASSTPLLPKQQALQEHATIHENTEPTAIATTLQATNADTLHANFPDAIETPQPDAQPFDIQETMLADNTVIQPSGNDGKRFHFTASIGASALPRIGAVDAGNDEYAMQHNAISGPSDSYISVSPSSTLAANVGVSYAIPLGGRQGLEVGIGLSGYSHQTEATTYTIGTTDGIDGIENTTIIPVGKPEIHSTFSLYASLPLTFNFRPKGKFTGWNLSLTPSHSIATSRPIGIQTGDRPILNPWRLTMGLGLAFPRGFIRRLSFTANLLSLYTSSPLHEVGIEIGF